jgi:hypothetical protein
MAAVLRFVHEMRSTAAEQCLFASWVIKINTCIPLLFFSQLNKTNQPAKSVVKIPQKGG